MKNKLDDVDELADGMKRLCSLGGSGPVIIDLHSETFKAGFAMEDAPRTLIHVDRLLGRKAFNIGSEAQALRNILATDSPEQNGVVSNWNDMETLLRHTFRNELRISPEEHPVLMTQSPLGLRKQKEKTTEIMFESFKSPAIYLATHSALALYASGRMTGLVLESGEKASQIVPIVNGEVLHYAIERLSFCDADLTAYLKRLLMVRSSSYSTIGNEIIRDIKEKLCFLSMDCMQKVTVAASEEKSYRAPDGRVVKLGYERFACPEALFHPAAMGATGSGIHISIANALLKCGIGNRRDLLANIVLIGGNSKLPNICERLHKEVAELLPPAKIAVTVPPTEADLIWTGASLVATLPSFQPMWISKEEYEDAGPYIVHRKCL